MTVPAPPDPVVDLNVYWVDLSQSVPYLGPLRTGESVNPSGYFVRQGNRTVYAKANRSLVVRLETQSGIEGWGETYGLITPEAPAALLNDLIRSFVLGRDPADREALHDELYDLMRVRGYTGGFYLDALAAVDIALWDIAGKITGQPVSQLLGGAQIDTLPAYVSGLPKATLTERCQLATEWWSRGFTAFKFALPVADDGVEYEYATLRQTLPEDARIACDLHWAFQADEAIQLAQRLKPHRPWFLEAPLPPEEVFGLQQVAEQAGESIAVGEEWRTVYDARLRIDLQACHIVQPEMGHTGITQFARIARHAAAHSLPVIPHATIGSGIFLAASLQASAALGNVPFHEFQHSVFEPFRHFTGDALVCESGHFQIPNGDGIGVTPSEAMRAAMHPIPA